MTKEQLLKKVRAWGFANRRDKPLTSQAIGMLLRNQLYACGRNSACEQERRLSSELAKVTLRKCATRA